MTKRRPDDGYPLTVKQEQGAVELILEGNYVCAGKALDITPSAVSRRVARARRTKRMRR